MSEPGPHGGFRLGRTLLLVTPSRASALELTRRLTRKEGATGGVFALTPADLALRLAEPLLLGSGIPPASPGRGALLARQLVEEWGTTILRLPPHTPTTPVALALERTLRDLRLAGVGPSDLRALAKRRQGGDRRRLVALSTLAGAFERSSSGAGDEAARLRAALRAVPRTAWLRRAQLVVVGDPRLHPLELELFGALATVTLSQAIASTLSPDTAAQLAARGFALVDWHETPLAPITPAPRSSGIEKLVPGLFARPSGADVRDVSVELLTAPGEAAEVRSLARRVLSSAAAGMPFDEMALLLPGVEPYVPLVTELFERIGIPFRLASPGPLRSGRSARSLELLLRCRGLGRRSVLEFLSFAPLPFADLLGPDAVPAPSRWDRLTREAGIVSGLGAWIVGLRGLAEAAEERARDVEDGEALRLRTRARDAEALLRLVELLSGTLDSLSGPATRAEWSARVASTLDQWLGAEADRAALVEAVGSLCDANTAESEVNWTTFEGDLLARLDAVPLPVVSPRSGAVHVGTFDDLAGLSFRLALVPGLVEGGFPGVLRPDPFLLDDERSELDALVREGANERTSARRGRQLRLFSAPDDKSRRLATADDRLRQVRERFRLALAQAREKIVLSYPRADPRTGRERLPSLFFVAAASAVLGRPVSAADLPALVEEDDPRDLPTERSLDCSERDRARVHRGGLEAAASIAAGCETFRRSRLAERARLSSRLTEFDGFLGDLPEDLRSLLDPASAPRPLSATRLSTFTQCGFRYLLETVLGVEVQEEPESGLGLDPRVKGVVFHAVAERFVRELCDSDAWPPKGEAREQERLVMLLDQELESAFGASPLRHLSLRERERTALASILRAWLAREAGRGADARPVHLELTYGPVAVDLGDGTSLAFTGRIDRIDRTREGGLVVRDYKTGRAPKRPGDPGLESALTIQLPLYVVAAQQLFEGETIVAALCDYVADGGQVRRIEDIGPAVAAFKRRVREAASALRDGLFVQNAAACVHCPFDLACGPVGLVASRRSRKEGDPRVKRLTRLASGA